MWTLSTSEETLTSFLGKKTTAFVITSYFLPYCSLSLMLHSATTHEMFPTDRRVLLVEFLIVFKANDTNKSHYITITVMKHSGVKKKEQKIRTKNIHAKKKKFYSVLARI